MIPRKYRPQRFSELIGQDALVTCLTNGLLSNSISHAYLFCGPRGCGKTSVARLLAKALNCTNPLQGFEPCNQCPSCLEITSGSSLDVIEIDGASHRGIDDIRQINETVGYAPASCKYKIYIIDEVHMLTKEAFNALLKTLEEPPENVKFFFATTEPARVPATIASRCQRFSLRRISSAKIENKLSHITKQLGRAISKEALELIAHESEGSLRDAEMILEQVMAFAPQGSVDASKIAEVLGTASPELLKALDVAVQEGRLSLAFELSHKLFDEGKDAVQFVDALIRHFRNHLYAHLVQGSASYSQEELLYLLEICSKARQEMRHLTSPQIALEALLISILHCKKRVSLQAILERLAELEAKVRGSANVKEETRSNLVGTKANLSVKKLDSDVASLKRKEVHAAKTQEVHAETLMRFAAVELEGTLKK